MSSLLLVTGASGQLGREVIQHLLETVKVQPGQIVAGTRHPEKLAGLASRGVQVRKLDFDDGASIVAAAQGVARAVLISTDVIDATDRRYRQHQAALKAFVAAGVHHVLYTSFAAVGQNSPLTVTDHHETEKALIASSLPGYTIIRNGAYFENLLGSLTQAVQSGSWPTACGQGRTAMLSRSDVGRATAYALSGKATGKSTIVLTGSETLTMDEIVAVVSKAAGKPISVAHLNDQEMVAIWLKVGLPEPVARFVVSLDACQRQGFLAATTEDYKKLTGQQPTKFSDWLLANKGLWMPK